MEQANKEGKAQREEERKEYWTKYEARDGKTEKSIKVQEKKERVQ
jgi:hypothetical protein